MMGISRQPHSRWFETCRQPIQISYKKHPIVIALAHYLSMHACARYASHTHLHRLHRNTPCMCNYDHMIINNETARSAYITCVLFIVNHIQMPMT